jgi:hypothetical protein
LQITTYYLILITFSFIYIGIVFFHYLLVSCLTVGSIKAIKYAIFLNKFLVVYQYMKLGKIKIISNLLFFFDLRIVITECLFKCINIIKSMIYILECFLIVRTVLSQDSEIYYCLCIEQCCWILSNQE